MTHKQSQKTSASQRTSDIKAKQKQRLAEALKRNLAKRKTSERQSNDSPKEG